MDILEAPELLLLVSLALPGFWLLVLIPNSQFIGHFTPASLFDLSLSSV